MQAAGLTAIAVMFGGLLVLAATADRASTLGRFFNNKVLVKIGTLSYGMYLFHQMVITALRRSTTLFNSEHPMSIAGSTLPVRIAFILTTMTITMLIAWISWTLFERPILRFKRRFANDDNKQ